MTTSIPATTETVSAVDDIRIDTRLAYAEHLPEPAIRFELEHTASLSPSEEVMWAVGLFDLDQAEALARRVLAQVALARTDGFTVFPDTAA